MRKALLIALGLLLVIVGIGYTENVLAQRSPFDIQFPIPELGNCGSLGECKTYCDDASHGRECTDWAERNGFAAPARPVVETGPGGCRGAECESFCDHPENRGQCLDFAEEHGLIGRDEAVRARASVERGTSAPQSGPGGCTSRKSCDDFCKNPANGNTCLDFGVANGFITPEEATRLKQLEAPRPGSSRGRRVGPERSRRIEPRQIESLRPQGPAEPEFDEEKAKAIIGSQGGPLGCATFEACDDVCSNPANDEACFDFAIQHELIGGPDVEKIKRLKDVDGPGGCRGRACEAYCEAPGHENECLEFARANGLIPDEEYQKVKKFIDIEGPGGCRGRACEAYCEAPGHEKECFEFARQNGLIDEDEAREIERFMTIVGPGGCMGRECEAYCNNPANGEECFEFAKQNGLIPPEEIGRIEELQRIQRRIDDRSRVREEEEMRFRTDENEGFRNGPPGPGTDEEFRFPPERGEDGGLPPFSPNDSRRFEEFRGDIPPEFEQFDGRPSFDPRGIELQREFNAEFESKGVDSEFDMSRDSHSSLPSQFDPNRPPEFFDAPDFGHTDGGFIEPRFDGSAQGGVPGEGIDSGEFRRFVPQQGDTFTSPPPLDQRFNERGGFNEQSIINFPPTLESVEPIQTPQQGEPISLIDFLVKSAAVIIGPFLRL